MGSLLALMNSSLSALQAEQAAMNVTSNNVANQNTVGYTRQTVQFSTLDSVSLNGSQTNGVTVGTGAISQRDRILEQRVQQQTQAQSQSAALSSAWQQVEGAFSLSSTSSSAASTALGTATDSFFSSLTALASNPLDTPTRQGVLSAASNLASAFNSVASQVTGVKASLDKQVAAAVGQVNSLTSTIAKLNAQIETASPNGDAGALEDQRQSALAQLSQYIGFNQVATDNNGITLTTGNGQLLVGGGSSFALSTTQVNDSTHIVSSTGQDITSQNLGGTLGGTIAARDTQLATVTNGLDTLANAIATAVNQQNAAGFDANGNAGQAIFSGASSGAFTAASISVAITDPKWIATAASGEGPAGNGNAQSLAGLSTSNIAGGTTASELYASLLSQIGSSTASAKTDDTQQQAALTQLTTQRDALSGVSLDQEAANLTQYQRSYQAAARVFSIVSSLMADAINLGQATAVS